jgi:hypothetical protein
MRGYLEPPDMRSDNRDPLAEPDRTSWSCLGRVLMALLLVVLVFAVIAAIGCANYLNSLP